MDSFKFNQMAMAVLGTVFIVMSLSFLSGTIYHNDKPEQQGYAVEVADTGASSGSTEDAGPAYEPISAILASADIGAGEKAAKKCAACHTFEQGGANKVGPALYDIVNKQIAATDGFSYSAALREYGSGKNWTYDELNGFLWNPKKFVKGTSMGFAGLKKTNDRANIVAYLRSLSASPAPLPDASAAETETESTESDSQTTESSD